MRFLPISRAAFAISLLILIGLSQVQAKTFSITRAVWDTGNQILKVKGYGESGTSVEIYAAGTDYLLASRIVNRKGFWRIWVFDPIPVPCSINVVSGSASAEFLVSSAPADCFDANDTQVDSGISPTLNHPPVISGTPDANIFTGEAYSFTPTASDLDGDNLEFSITNKPYWASFDTSTGMLSGIPSNNDIGLYEDIIIAVTDGSYSASLDPASIMVDDNSSGIYSTNLSWIIPTTRTDGSPLNFNEIAGYRVYMGSTTENLIMIIDLNDPTQTSYLISNTTTGTYYFSVTAYDLNDLESTYSNIVSKPLL